jgi:hypothetical protein
VQVDELPQPSVATYTLVTVEPQVTGTVTSGNTVTVGVPQLSVAVASPGFEGGITGLHPKAPP